MQSLVSIIIPAYNAEKSIINTVDSILKQNYLNFEENSFHPANIKITAHGLKVQEARVLNRVTWEYAYVKGMTHDLKCFVHGEKYKFLGVFESDIHFMGTVPDENGKVYPAYLFGADNLGRDMLSRMIYGSRISLTIGFVATAISLLLAIILGSVLVY